MIPPPHYHYHHHTPPESTPLSPQHNFSLTLSTPDLSPPSKPNEGTTPLRHHLHLPPDSTLPSSQHTLPPTLYTKDSPITPSVYYRLVEWLLRAPHPTCTTITPKYVIHVDVGANAHAFRSLHHFWKYFSTTVKIKQVSGTPADTVGMGIVIISIIHTTLFSISLLLYTKQSSGHPWFTYTEEIFQL